MANETKYIDKNGLNRFSNGIADVIKLKLDEKANTEDVVTRDYIEENYVDKTTYSSDQSAQDTAINKKANSSDVYTKSQMDATLSGYLTNIVASDTYATKTYVEERIPDTSTFYTRSEADDKFCTKEHATYLQEQITNLQSEVDALRSIASIGVVSIWSGDVSDIPAGFLLCDGSVYNISEYEDLYNVIGNRYDDSESSSGDTFCVPDMTGILRGMNYIIKY